MKAIDELRIHMKLMRDQGLTMVAMSTINTHLNEIERELEEHYIELPVDADDVPIKVNDEMESVHRPKEVFIVKRLKYSEKHGWMIGGAARDDLSEYGLYAPFNCHHYKPPTVEDVLREFAKSIAEVLGGDEFLLRDDDEMYAEFAERLQLKERDDG